MIEFIAANLPVVICLVVGIALMVLTVSAVSKVY